MNAEQNIRDLTARINTLEEEIIDADRDNIVVRAHDLRAEKTALIAERTAWITRLGQQTAAGK